MKELWLVVGGKEDVAGGVAFGSALNELEKLSRVGLVGDLAVRAFDGEEAFVGFSGGLTENGAGFALDLREHLEAFLAKGGFQGLDNFESVPGRNIYVIKGVGDVIEVGALEEGVKGFWGFGLEKFDGGFFERGALARAEFVEDFVDEEVGLGFGEGVVFFELSEESVGFRGEGRGGEADIFFNGSDGFWGELLVFDEGAEPLEALFSGELEVVGDEFFLGKGVIFLWGESEGAGDSGDEFKGLGVGGTGGGVVEDEGAVVFGDEVFELEGRGGFVNKFLVKSGDEEVFEDLGSGERLFLSGCGG